MKRLIVLSLIMVLSACTTTDNNVPKTVNIASLDAIEKYFSGNQMSSLRKDQELQKYVNNIITVSGFKINGEPVVDQNSGLYVFMVQDMQNRCRIKIWVEGDDSKIVDLKQGDVVSFTGIIKTLEVNDIRGTPLQDAAKTFDFDILLHLFNVKILN